MRAHHDAIASIFAKHKGRVFKTTGDGLLAEFPSVLDAVAAAGSIQAVIAAGNSGADPARRLEFRIGVHVGDVIAEGEGTR